MITTTETHFGARVAVFPTDRLAEHAPALFWHRHDAQWELPPKVAPQSDAVPAFVSGGRWLVQCSACLSAQHASPADPRFFCIDCLNEHVEGAWLPVAWPKDRAAIEALLDARPAPHTRTWMPNETVEDLRRQNEEHGLS